jgi:hypothetical protein
MEPLIEPARSNGLVAFELPSAEGQPSVKCIALTAIVVALKKIELQAKGEVKSDQTMKIAATKLLREHKDSWSLLQSSSLSRLATRWSVR